MDNISPSESSLVEAGAALLVDDNNETRPWLETSTLGLVSSQGNLIEHDLKIQEALQNQDIEIDASKRLRSFFCSYTVFNLSHRVLSELEICVLSKGLGFCTYTYYDQ